MEEFRLRFLRARNLTHEQRKGLRYIEVFSLLPRRLEFIYKRHNSLARELGDLICAALIPRLDVFRVAASERTPGVNESLVPAQ